jgi:hypothetical protein
MAGNRRNITAATEAALWALSNGRCYAPGCPFPVVFEVKRGVFRKNAQISHIYGVKVGAPRYQAAMPDSERDSFSNLLLLCLAHHAEVDHKSTGAQQYPPDLLHEWKTTHEGADSAALAALGRIDEETLTDLLTEAFAPPIERLQSIADQLERTGTLTADSLGELKRIIRVLADSPTGLDSLTAKLVADAAEVYGTPSFNQAASHLADAADVLSVSGFASNSSVIMDAADSIANSVDWLRRNRGYFDH